MIYIVIALSLLILQIVYIYKQKTCKRLNFLIYIFISVFLIFFAGTRKDIGLDFASYKEIFDVVKMETMEGSSLEHIKQIYAIESLFLYFNLVSPNFPLFLFIMALLGVGIKLICIGKNCNNKYICLFIYFSECFLYFEMGAIRQGIAISFMMISLFCLLNEKKYAFFLFAILGSFFHITALLILPFYFIAYKNITVKWMLMLLILCIPFAFFDIRPILLDVSQRVSVNWLYPKLEYYFTGVAVPPYGTIIKCAFIFILFVVLYKIMKINNNRALFFLKCYWYGIILMIVFSANAFFAVRGTKFFFLIQLFAVDQILCKSKKNRYTLFLTIFFALLYIRTLMQIIPGGESNNFQFYTPYNSYIYDFLNGGVI